MAAPRIFANAGEISKEEQRMTELTRKPCPRCGQSKPLAEFYAHKWRADGRCDVCAECSKAASRARKDAKRAAGLCVDCGAPSAGARYCPACTDKRKFLAYGVSPEATPPAEKPCARCGQSKPLAEFYARPWGADTICRECGRASFRARYKARERAGVCRLCGGALDTPAAATCPRCRENRRRRRNNI